MLAVVVHVTCKSCNIIKKNCASVAEFTRDRPVTRNRNLIAMAENRDAILADFQVNQRLHAHYLLLNLYAVLG